MFGIAREQSQQIAIVGRRRIEGVEGLLLPIVLAERFREAVYRTVGRWLKGVYPVSTGIVVSALARPEWLVEIDVIAVIPERDA